MPVANTSSYAGAAAAAPNTPSSYRAEEDLELEGRSPGTASKMSSSKTGAEEGAGLALAADEEEEVVGPLNESKSESKEDAEEIGRAHV